MERLLRQRHAEAIAEALRRIPAGARELVADVDFLVGVDPLYVGLHRNEFTPDGRSYRDTAHACYAHATSDGRRTIAYPEIDSEPLKLQTLVLVHELGHQVDDALRRPGRPAPVSRYAQKSRGEAFAEAFVLYCAPDLCSDSYGLGSYDADVLAQDHPTLALFERLGGNPRFPVTRVE